MQLDSIRSNAPSCGLIVPMRWIYISPHLDDAVLSAGGLLYDQSQKGIPVEIWTIVCGFPKTTRLSDYARLLHASWGIDSAYEVVSTRRKEDKLAAKIVGARSVHFDVPDCIYRLGPNDEFLYNYIFVPPHEFESQLPAKIAKMLSARLKEDDVVLCQLSVGGHVDHVLVRQGVELLERSLLYVADIPYLLNTPEDLDEKILGMKETQYPITKTGLEHWKDAVAAHATQMNELFNGEDLMREAIQSYWQQRQGVRLWEIAYGKNAP